MMMHHFLEVMVDSFVISSSMSIQLTYSISFVTTGHGCSQERSVMHFQDLMDRCQNRIMAFDNKSKDERKLKDQTAELLRMVDNLVAQNGGEPYTNAIFKEAQVRGIVDNFLTQTIEAAADIDHLF